MIAHLKIKDKRKKREEWPAYMRDTLYFKICILGDYVYYDHVFLMTLEPTEACQ